MNDAGDSDNSFKAVMERRDGGNMKRKKWMAAVTAAAMAAGMLAGCGNSTENGSGGNADGSSGGSTGTEQTVNGELSGTKISFLNSKGEVQEALEDMAEAFKDETGIEVEIVACGAGESPYTKITSAYNAGTAPTMAMLDTTDVIVLAKEYALDLSDQDWLAECENQITRVDGNVYSFPFCVEGRGIIYNKTAIEKTLGEEFNPSAINSYDALKALLESLKAAGMEYPVVVSKEDWSLGAHQLGFIYDTYDGTTEGSETVIGQFKEGALKAEDYERFNQFADTLDLLLEYNINGDDPLGALYDQDPMFLADADAAIWVNGNWAWPNLVEAGASEEDEYGFIPYVLGNDTADFANTGIQAAASKQVMIDAAQASETEIAAAKEFLNWIVYSDNGQKMLVENAALIPACRNNPYEPVDPLGKDIQERLVSGKSFSSSFIAPSDHWSVLGASMQKYIAGQSTREELARDIDKYWESQK